MNILTQITTAAATASTNDRGAVKRFILATLSYAKHNGLKLTNKQVAELTRANVPGSKTSAGSVADYITNLNCGLFDYVTLAEAEATLASFDKTPAVEAAPQAIEQPKAPWSASDLVYKAKPVRKSRAKKS